MEKNKMGKFVKTQQRTRKAVTGTTELETDIPTGNFISKVGFLLSGLGHATQTKLTLEAAISSIELRADGEVVLKRLTGADIRALMVKRDQIEPLNKTSTTTSVETFMEFVLNFGMQDGDTTNILPAKLYEDLVLRVELDATNLSYFTTASYLDVWTQEYISDDNPYEKNILKEKRFKSITAGTTEIYEKLEQGEILRDIMMYMSVIGAQVHKVLKLELNQGTIVPYTSTVIKTIADNEREFKLDANAKTQLVASGYLTTAYFFMNLRENIDTKPLNDIYIRYDRTASSTFVIITQTMVKPAFKVTDYSDVGKTAQTPPYLM